MSKPLLSILAAMLATTMAATPVAAVAVTALPSGDTMVTSDGQSGVFNFLDENWDGATRFDPVANVVDYGIAITFNPADGLIYGVNGWWNTESQQVYSVDPITGDSQAWDIDYGNGDSSGYETRSIAFDGDGGLVALVCQQVEWAPGEFECPDSDIVQSLVSLTLTDAGVAEAGTFLDLDYSTSEFLASVAWNPITESFFVLGYEPRDLAEVASDGSLGQYLDVTVDTLDLDYETTDLAFDSDGNAWVSYEYGERIVSVDLSDGTITDVANGNDAEGMTIIRPPVVLAETGVESSHLAVLALTAISALGAGAWAARRRSV